MPAPEREKPGQTLPIIPNEIYFCIFERVAPSAGPLTPEQVQAFTRLSRVCRFFANFCLPRVFELVEFSGSIFHDDTPTQLRNDAAYKTSRESVLCAQIAAKQPLALALAKVVKVCRFKHWKLDEAGSWAVRLFATKYIAGMLHMTNIRELEFTDSFVDEEHWNAASALPSLEKLSFIFCKFFRGPADVELEKRVKIKVSHLRVLHCATGFRQPLAAIDVQCLRALDIDHKHLDQVDWHLLSSLAELRFHDPYGAFRVTEESFVERLPAFLVQAPQSLETLRLAVDSVAQATARNVFDDPAWGNLASLRSLTLLVKSQSRAVLLDVVSQTFIERMTIN